MKRSEHHILTTITGSLPRPDALVDLMREKENDRPYDRAKFDAMVVDAVKATVHRECELGLSIPSDGEQSKSGFGSYQAERYGGFSVVGPVDATRSFALPEVEHFPEYYDRYFRTNMLGASLGPRVQRACTG